MFLMVDVSGVDAEFEKLLGEIFGVEFIETFKARRPAGWVDLMIAFESRKRAANPHKTSALNVSLPFSFIDFHKKHLVGSLFCSPKIGSTYEEYNKENKESYKEMKTT